MSAVVVPFPIARRRGDVQGVAANMQRMRHDRAEAYLRSFSKRLAADLRRKQIDPSLIAAEIVSLEGSVRAALWRRVLSPGGAA